MKIKYFKVGEDIPQNIVHTERLNKNELNIAKFLGNVKVLIIINKYIFIFPVTENEGVLVYFENCLIPSQNVFVFHHISQAYRYKKIKPISVGCFKEMY